MRKVQAEGWFSYRGRRFRLSKALRGFAGRAAPIRLSADSLREVLSCHQPVALIDLNQ